MIETRILIDGEKVPGEVWFKLSLDEIEIKCNDDYYKDYEPAQLARLAIKSGNTVLYLGKYELQFTDTEESKAFDKTFTLLTYKVLKDG